MKKILAMKTCGADNFSVTRYHIAEALVDREVEGGQVINSKYLCYSVTFMFLYIAYAVWISAGGFSRTCLKITCIKQLILLTEENLRWAGF